MESIHVKVTHPSGGRAITVATLLTHVTIFVASKVLWDQRPGGKPAEKVSMIHESTLVQNNWPFSGYGFRKNKSSHVRSDMLDSVILDASLMERVKNLAHSTAKTKDTRAPFRNMLLTGPPGTGKSLVATEIARKSGLDYAIISGGDVSPTGANTEIHQIFDAAGKSKRGLLLLIDEADAFLYERKSNSMSQVHRSSPMNALLSRAGGQSRDIVLVLVTNRPEVLDSCIMDRIDEVLEFSLPAEHERYKLLKQYIRLYVTEASIGKNTDGSQQVTLPEEEVDERVIQDAAFRTVGFSARDLAKLVACYALVDRHKHSSESTIFSNILDSKLKEHEKKSSAALVTKV